MIPISFKLFPSNFKQLFAFPHKFCSCHQRRMTCANIFEHEGFDFDRWLTDMLSSIVGKRGSKKKKLKSAMVRR